MSDDLTIDVDHLTKSFSGRVVVDRVGMRVRPGEIYGFLGPNGSGKTTFLRMLCGLLRPDSGSGRCLGFDVLRQSDAIKRATGYMTQRFSLYEDLSLAENLDFVARLYDVPHRKEAVHAALERLGLTARAKQLAGHLSGGWKQRLALAACLLHQPQLLLLDEPTAGVDPKARRDFWDQIHALAAQGLTVLVTTHYMDEAERCHRIAYISFGRLLIHGTADEVVAHAGLHTWTVTAPDPWVLADRLRVHPGIEQVVPMGHVLRVSAHDPDTLTKAAQRYDGQGIRWQSDAPSLEDVFISLMGHSRDNFQEARP
jgi:ABC-2 type transport system ATP-binding protein